MEYIPLDTQKYYKECNALIQPLGYQLIELRITPQKTQYKILAVVGWKSDSAPADGAGIGVNDCAKAHRLIEPRLETLLGTENIYMEVTSPGMERNIKNAAEFALFTGNAARVWDAQVSDWVSGTIVSSDETAITLNIPDAGEQTIPYDRIQKAKLVHV